MAGRFSLPRETAFDADGNPIAGAKLEFFESGTSTPQDTFSDDALTVANTNPVIADSAGRFGDIFLSNADYKVTLSDADDVVIWTADPVRAPVQKSTVVRTILTTSNINVGDDGKLIAADCTSGAFTATLPAAATAGDGFEVAAIKIDSSTNAFTIDGNGAETINGLSDIQFPDQYSAAILRCNGTTWFAYAITPTTSTRILPAAYFEGFKISNNSTDPSNDIDVAAGTCRSDDDQGNIVLTVTRTKRLDASFAEGNNQGGLDTGSRTADTVYNLWAIGKVDGTADILFSLSDTSPTLPSGFTLQRRIGAIMTDGSSNIHADQFSQVFMGGEELRAERDISSGTEHDFIGIRDSAVEIIGSFSGLSTNGTSIPVIQLGDSGGIEATGYQGTTYNPNAQVALSAGFRLVTAHSASVVLEGGFRLNRIIESSNTWSASGAAGRSDTTQGYSVGGSKSLSATLTQLRLTTEGGSNTFDGSGVMSLYVRYLAT